MEQLRGSIRFYKLKMNEGTKVGKKYFRSFQEQWDHAFRIEEMDKGYLTRPEETKNNKSKVWVDRKKVNNKWIDCQGAFKKKYNKSMQKTTKPVLNFLLSFSKGFDLPEEDRKKQHQAVIDYIEEHFDFPIYVVQHNDEKSLHYEFCVLNFEKKNHSPIARKIDTSALQDQVFDYLKSKGADYGHTRGVSKDQTKMEHIEVLEGKLKTKEEELAQKEALLQEKMKQISMSEIRIKDLEEEIEDTTHKLNKVIEEKEEEISSLNERVQTVEDTFDTTLEELNDLITSIIDLGETTTAESFLKKMTRIAKSGDSERLTNLITKVKSVKTKIEKTQKSRSQGPRPGM